MPTGSYANPGGSCFQEINTTKSDQGPNKLALRQTHDSENEERQQKRPFRARALCQIVCVVQDVKHSGLAAKAKKNQQVCCKFISLSPVHLYANAIINTL